MKFQKHSKTCTSGQLIVLFWLIISRTLGAATPADDVNPFIGTAGHGHTYPGATVPFGFVQLSPDTRGPTTPWTVKGWDGCSGYHYSDNSLVGFSHTHLTGTGRGDLGDLLILPLTGDLNETGNYRPISAERFRTGFSHANEVAQPGYYRVLLDKYHVLAELTATAHAGMQAYTFPASKKSHILIDLVHGLENSPVDCALTVESNTLITGYRQSSGWADGRTVYFVIQFSRPFKTFGLESNDKPVDGLRDVHGKYIRGQVDFKTSEGEKIVLRVGLSPTSIEEAKRNLSTEIGDQDFSAIRAAARAAWNENLSRISIDSDNPGIRTIFYSALYHSMTAPTLYNNADGSYIGPDRAIHATPRFQYHSTFSMWDIFRAEIPLMTLVEPERIDDFVKSMLAFYHESPAQALPMWPLANSETGCMIGYHSVPIIYDAYAKGFHGFEPAAVYEAMTNTALSKRNRQDEYQILGYVPWVADKSEAVSRTLEFSYDDWCIAEMAKKLGKTADSELFLKRSQNYRNVWDPAAKFFRAKNPDGSFHEPFDPKEVATGDDTATGSYTEANAWQYAFAILQDVPGMIQLYGGNNAFIQRLDQFFDQDSDMTNWRIDVTGLVGQYAHGNEPDQHVPYLYALAGAQYKTAQRVRQIQLTQYDNSPDGICGNDDCGQISAWYVWSAIGLYPVNPASGIYVIGSPLVKKAIIKLDSKYYPGTTFTIEAHDVSNQNMYIQSAKLNGKPLNRPWITHEEIAKGGNLEFEMGILPNKKWPKQADD